MGDHLFTAMRHDTLKAIESGEKFLKALAGKPGKAATALHDSTQRLLDRLESELVKVEEAGAVPKSSCCVA